MPPTPSETSERRLALERRRRVFTSLFAASAVTLVPALMGLPGVLWLHVILDCVLGCFVGFLIQDKQRSLSRYDQPAVAAPRFAGDLDPAFAYGDTTRSNAGRHSAPSGGYTITPNAPAAFEFTTSPGRRNGPFIFDAEDDELYVTTG